MSMRNVLILVSIPALLAACSTTQESPIYQQSTKYKVHSPYSTTTDAATTHQANYPATQQIPSHQTVTYTTQSSAPIYHHATTSTGDVYSTQVNHECLDKEGKRKLIGTAIGGAAGALAGNKIGDNTTGTIIGGVVGAAAGYGVADVTTNCDPIPVASPTGSQSYVAYPAAQPAGYHAISNSTGPIIHDSATTEQMVNAELQNAQAPTDSAYGDTFGTPGYHAMIANGELDETTTASVSLPEAPAYVPPTPIPSPTPAPFQSYPQIISPAPQYMSGGYTTHTVVEGDTVYSLSRRLCVDVGDIKNLNSLNSAFYIRLDDTIKLPASRC